MTYPIEKILLCLNFDACNLRCIMCWTTSAREANRQKEGSRDLDRDALMELLRDPSLAHADIQVVGGGEPFLYPHMDEFLRECARLQRRLMIMTNGTLLHRSEALWEVAETADLTLTFSLDAACAETYARIRPPGNWHQVVANLERFGGYRERNPRLKLQTSFVVLTDNVGELLDYLKLNARWGSTYAHLHPAIAYGRGDEKRVNLASATYQQIVGEALAFAAEYGIAMDPVEELLPGPLVQLGEAPPPVPDARQTCVLWKTSMTVNHEGDIYVCDTAFRRGYTCGNIVRDGVAAVWDSPNWRSLRQAHETGTQKTHRLCQHCVVVGAEPVMRERVEAARPGPMEIDVCVVGDGGEQSALFAHANASLVAGVRLHARERSDWAVRPEVIFWEPARLDPAAWAAVTAGAVLVVRDRSLAPGAGEPRMERLLADLAATGLDWEQVLGPGAALQATATPFGLGEVLWLGVLPDLAGCGFDVERHNPARAAIAQLVVDEVLAYAFARKHGIEVRKRLGPHGAPMFAWQAHLEEAGGMGNGSAEHFVARVKAAGQVATLSLIRNMLRWGHRTPGLVRLGGFSPDRRLVSDDAAGPAMFSGEWIRREDGTALGFAPDPRYVEHYMPTPGQPRIYPSPWLDGRLALGTPEGEVILYDAVSTGGRFALANPEKLRLATGEVLRVEGAASPTVARIPDSAEALLVVASAGGSIEVFRNAGQGWRHQQRIAVDGCVSPRLCDWFGSGVLDLMVGREDGKVELWPDFAARGAAHRRELFATARPQVAPFPMVEWNRRRVLLGDRSGCLALWEEGVIYPLGAASCAAGGSYEPYLQQSSVPVVMDVDGRQTLLCGACVAGAPEPAAASPQWERLLAAGVPVNAHLSFAPAMLPAQMARELARHRERFTELGLPWNGMGANQHLWLVPRGRAAEAFTLQQAAGLRFNFGWKAPGCPAEPAIAVEFALAVPFLLPGSDFVLFAPSTMGRFSEAHEFLAAQGWPVSFHLHPEYRVTGAGAEEAERWVEQGRAMQQRHGAVWVTENEMAQHLAAALSARIVLRRLAQDVVEVRVEDEAVPGWARPALARLAVSVRGDGPMRSDATVTSLRDGTLLATAGNACRVFPATAEPAGIAWSTHPSRQDQWLMHKVFAGRREPGYFVDTGAADGVSASATLALERHFGWSGICVEPNTQLFERLRANRRCHVENACVSSHTGEAYFVEASWYGRIYDHARHEWPDGDYRRDPYLRFDFDGSPAAVSRKACYTLDDLLRKHHAPRTIDFLSVDAEFSEWHVLAEFPFPDWNVLAVSVDTKFTHDGALLDRPHRTAVRDLMRRHGYRWDQDWSRGIEHDLFVRDAYPLNGHHPSIGTTPAV